MPLSQPKARRESLHRRTIEIRGWKREDGLYDIEGHLVDAKDVDFRLQSGLRPRGEPVHSMWLRITVDAKLHIVDAEACTDAMPYAGDCDTIAPAYRQLVGLAIRPGYQKHVKELLGGVRGCTHITELALALATGAFQTLAGQGHRGPGERPPQLDKCHALESTQPAVAKYYPKWYRGTERIAATHSDHPPRGTE
jgi:hypothetical protein